MASYKQREKIIYRCVALAFLGIAARAAQLQLFGGDRAILERLAERQYKASIASLPSRGLILDRKRHPLAISVKKPSVAINPRVFEPSAHEVRELATILGMPSALIHQQAKRGGYFAWLKRQVPAAAAQEVEALQIPGIHIIPEPSRSYPASGVASHLVGFVGRDNQGLAGVESQFNHLLQSQQASLTPLRDARNRTIYIDANKASAASQGHNVILTIDMALQEIAEEALKAGVIESEAKSGFVIVADPHTGQLLAVANYPTFNPNPAAGQKRELVARNAALLDVFEPGSTLKPLVVATALEMGKTHPNELLDCENGTLDIAGTKIHDDHPASLLTTSQVLIRSSNICTYKIAERLGKQNLANALRRFGIGGTLTRPENDIPTSVGALSDPESWRPIRFANIAFGQGLLVSGIEMVSAFSAIANGGHLLQPYLVEKIENAEGVMVVSHSPQTVQLVISPKVAETMRHILAEVVYNKDGTGKRAAAPSYRVAGKTGTAEKVDPKTKAYSLDKRLSSFIGFAPVNDPRIVVLVVMDEPGKKFKYGALCAAPVFSQIVEKSLRYLNVDPEFDSHGEPGHNSEQQDVATHGHAKNSSSL